jgi:hypothetical protein
MQMRLWWRLWWGLAESAFGGSLESGGRFCVGAFGRNLESGGLFCVGAFGGNLTSVALNIFSHLLYTIKKFYKLCAIDAICKDNVAINCITK